MYVHISKSAVIQRYISLRVVCLQIQFVIVSFFPFHFLFIRMKTTINTSFVFCYYNKQIIKRTFKLECLMANQIKIKRSQINEKLFSR